MILPFHVRPGSRRLRLNLNRSGNPSPAPPNFTDFSHRRRPHRGYDPHRIMQTSSEKLRDAWARHAAAVARKVNLAWWLETVSVPLVVVGLIGACVLLLVRREIPQSQPW